MKVFAELLDLLTVVLLFLFILFPILFVIPGLYQSAKRKREQKKKRELWLEKFEPQFRNAQRYPEDWQDRRQEVFRLSSGRCAACGKQVGFLGGHVHHIRPISEGGNHAISNLEFLCEDCHVAKHPNNRALRINRNRRRLYIGRNAGIKHARKQWTCAVCEKPIEAGDDYYGGKHHKLCLQCHAK